MRFVSNLLVPKVQYGMNPRWNVGPEKIGWKKSLYWNAKSALMLQKNQLFKNLLLSSPHQHISLFKNQAPSKVKCHRTAFCRDQTVTERPVRPRVSAPAIVEILAIVFICHTPVTLIKSTYLLTYLLWDTFLSQNRVVLGSTSTFKATCQLMVVKSYLFMEILNFCATTILIWCYKLKKLHPIFLLASD